jgi:hypothetical protein
MTHARIYASDWQRYREAHAKLRGEAARKLEEYFDQLPWDTDPRRALQRLCDFADQLLLEYGTADATLSASLYDEMMRGSAPMAELAELPSSATVYANMRDAITRATSLESARSMATGEMQRLVKRCGVETMRQNAVAHDAMWAWVCIGDTCAFCRTLGSRGWVSASRAVQAGTHAEHIHGNCDCEFVVRRPGDELEIEGYDPDALRAEYEAADGKSSKDVINAMRRADYTPEYAERRNARRRELYRAARDEGASPEEAADA